MTNDLHHLAAAYALDSLDSVERAAFEAHYPSCQICSADVVDYRETAAVLGAGVSSVPPADLKASVMARVAETRQLSPLSSATVEPARPRRIGPLSALAAVAAGLILLVAVAALARSGSNDFADVVAAPDAIFSTLEGDTGSIEAIWSPARDQVALRSNRLAESGADLEYALWFFVGEGVVPAGLFEPDNDGQLMTVLDLDDLDGTRWAVTIEPEGGSPQPTGEVLFDGEVNLAG